MFIDDISKCKTDYDNPYENITDSRILGQSGGRNEEEPRRRPKLKHDAIFLGCAQHKALPVTKILGLTYYRHTASFP